MATYAELKAKAEKLFAEAETQRLKEVAEAIDGMKAKIAELGIKASDLGFHFTAPATNPAKKPIGEAIAEATEKVVKYQRGEETWSGGRGRKPKWILELLEKNEDIEQFRVN